MPSLLFLKTLSKAAAAAAKPILPNGRMLLGQLPPKSPLLPSPQQPLRPSKTFTNSKFAPSKAIHRYLLEPTQNHQLHKGNSPQAATSPNLLQWWLAPRQLLRYPRVLAEARGQPLHLPQATKLAKLLPCHRSKPRTLHRCPVESPLQLVGGMFHQSLAILISAHHQAPEPSPRCNSSNHSSRYRSRHCSKVSCSSPILMSLPKQLHIP